jgi:hypothetical protein
VTTPDPLQQALEPFSADSDLAQATLAALGKLLSTTATDLATTPDKDILAHDSTHLARVNYTLALLRMIHVLRHTPDGFSEKLAQARFAFDVVKYAGDSNLEKLQLGRQKGDDDLAKAVAKQQAEIKRLAGAIAKTTPEAKSG